MADELMHGFRLILNAAGVERIVWPSSDDGIPDLTDERQRLKREAAILHVRAAFGYELDEDGIVAARRCQHTNGVIRCAKQGKRRADGRFVCSGHARMPVDFRRRVR